MGFAAGPSVGAPCTAVAAAACCNLMHSYAASAGLDLLSDYKEPSAGRGSPFLRAVNSGIWRHLDPAACLELSRLPGLCSVTFGGGAASRTRCRVDQESHLLHIMIARIHSYLCFIEVFSSSRFGSSP